jgi:hypothetical protein
MKPTRYKKWAVMALALVNGFFAAAQPNNMPGPTDYERFSSFITQRNIFDPSRYAINPYRPRPISTQQRRYAPAFTLVGTMSYEKGMFAFFDGNQFNLRKVLYQSDSNNIAGFTVAEITLAGVKLQTADKKQTVQMKIGETMRQEGNNWQLAGQGGLFAGTSAAESAAPAATESSSSSPDTSAAPSPALEANDVLKKLMQQREKELK